MLHPFNTVPFIIKMSQCHENVNKIKIAEKNGVNYFPSNYFSDNLRVSIDEPTAIATALKTIQFTANSMVIRINFFSFRYCFAFVSLITQNPRRQFLNAQLFFFSCFFSEVISLSQTTFF